MGCEGRGGGGWGKKGYDGEKMGQNAQYIPGFYDEAPSRPDGACGSQGEILGEGELFDWTIEVADSRNDNGPLCIYIDIFFSQSILY